MRRSIVALSVLVLGSLSAKAVEIDFSHYGFLKGAYMHTDGEIVSDHKAFRAKKPDNTTTNEYSELEKESRGQFSIKQSRWGFVAKSGENISAKFEFDLDGESGNSNGATDSSTGIIRVRQANLSQKLFGGAGTLTLGKKWTKFMGVLPHTYSFTTVNFFSGNTGFLVDGVDYAHSFGDLLVSLELINMGDNTTTKISGPVKTLLVNYSNASYRVGAAYTMASLSQRVQDAANNEDSDAMGAKVFASAKIMENFDIRAEYYMGENLGSIHTGALENAVATDSKDYKESGYFVSAKYNFSNAGLYASYGSAEVDTSSDVAVDANQLVSNSLTRVGVDTMYMGTTFYVEYQGFDSEYAVSATPHTTKSYDNSLIEVGAVYKF